MIAKILHASRATANWLGSRMAVRLMFGLFLVEALWFVFSAQYPMAFDENYHFGLIKLHAQQWLPFFTAQPHNASVFGAVVRDPSYLYHWLMSFPYRLLLLCTHNQTAIIIGLRLINVAIFALALTLYWRVIRKIGVSRALTTSLMAVFILIPVVPFLAAHINYDNLLVLAIPLTALLSMNLLEGFRERRVDARTLLLLLGTLFLACLIKYPFLPICAIVVAFVVWCAWRQKLISRAGAQRLLTSFHGLSRLRQFVLVAFVLVSFGLFSERYVANIVTYHNPIPACDAVISQDECEQYGPYGRDHVYAQEKPADFHANIFVYIGDWFYGMWYRLFFAISYDYATSPPLLVISCLSIVLAALLLLGTIMRFRTIFAGQPLRQLLLWIVLGYILVLFVDGFSAYRKTAQPVAINGRYLIPVLLFIFAIGGLAWSQILAARSTAKTVIATVVIAVFLLQGGGTMTFIIRSGDTWMWNNGTVRAANRVVRSAVWPFIIGKGIF